MEAHGMKKPPDYDQLLDMIEDSTPSMSIKGKAGTRTILGG